MELKWHLSTAFLNVHKTYGPRREKKTKAQTSLRIRSDLVITQLHQTRPAAAVQSNFNPKKALAGSLFLAEYAYLVWSFFFQFPLN